MAKKFKFKGKVSVYDPPEKGEKDCVGQLRPGTIKTLFGEPFGDENAEVTLFFNNSAEASVALFAQQLLDALKDSKNKKFTDLEEFLRRICEGYVDVNPSPLKGQLVEEAAVPSFPVS